MISSLFLLIGPQTIPPVRKQNAAAISVELSFKKSKVRLGEELLGDITLRNVCGYSIYIAPIGYAKWIVEPVEKGVRPDVRPIRGSYAIPKRTMMCYLPPEFGLTHPAPLLIKTVGTFTVYREIGRDLPTDAKLTDCWSGTQKSNPIIVTVTE